MRSCHRGDDKCQLQSTAVISLNHVWRHWRGAATRRRRTGLGAPGSTLKPMTTQLLRV